MDKPTLQSTRGPFFLEKWYMDTLLSDGSVLLVYLGRMRVVGFSVGRVTAELFLPDGTRKSGGANAHSISDDADGVTFGPARLERGLLRFDTAGLRGSLRFEPRASPVVLRDPFLVQGSGRLDWHVEVPDADVSGRLEWPAGSLNVEGRGYRDHVWFDIAPWRLPIRELKWGRACTARHATTWVEATTASGRVGGTWSDGHALDEGTPPELGPPRTLVDAAVVDLEALRLGPLRPVLRSITGDPREIKWAAEATIGGESGRAIHEVVKWR